MIFVVKKDEHAGRHVADLIARGYEVKSVGGGGEGLGDSKTALIREFASSLGLPDWFGHNLDALLDALRYLESSDGRPIALVWRPASALHRLDPQLYGGVLGVFDQVEGERDDLRVTVIEE